MLGDHRDSHALSSSRSRSQSRGTGRGRSGRRPPPGAAARRRRAAAGSSTKPARRRDAVVHAGGERPGVRRHRPRPPRWWPARPPACRCAWPRSGSAPARSTGTGAGTPGAGPARCASGPGAGRRTRGTVRVEPVRAARPVTPMPNTSSGADRARTAGSRSVPVTRPRRTGSLITTASPVQLAGPARGRVDDAVLDHRRCGCRRQSQNSSLKWVTWAIVRSSPVGHRVPGVRHVALAGCCARRRSAGTSGPGPAQPGRGQRELLRALQHDQVDVGVPQLGRRHSTTLAGQSRSGPGPGRTGRGRGSPAPGTGACPARTLVIQEPCTCQSRIFIGPSPRMPGRRQASRLPGQPGQLATAATTSAGSIESRHGWPGTGQIRARVPGRARPARPAARYGTRYGAHRPAGTTGANRLTTGVPTAAARCAGAGVRRPPPRPLRPARRPASAGWSARPGPPRPGTCAQTAAVTAASPGRSGDHHPVAGPGQRADHRPRPGPPTAPGPVPRPAACTTT